ncbi:hypothetical protein R6Z07M_011276 [Ovis aries]
MPPRNSHGDWPFLRPPERVPEVPVVEMKDPFAACSEENPGHSSRIARGGALHRKGRDEGSFPCLVGKEFWAFPSHLKRRRSPQERREEVKRRATIPRVPLMSQSIPEDLFSLCCIYFHDEDRLRPRRHVGQLCTKSSCESLEGNPRGKATDPMIDAMASVTLLPQLGRKAHVHAPSQEED